VPKAQKEAALQQVDRLERGFPVIYQRVRQRDTDMLAGRKLAPIQQLCAQCGQAVERTQQCTIVLSSTQQPHLCCPPDLAVMRAALEARKPAAATATSGSGGGAASSGSSRQLAAARAAAAREVDNTRPHMKGDVDNAKRGQLEEWCKTAGLTYQGVNVPALKDALKAHYFSK
jgi:hypothetical protein